MIKKHVLSHRCMAKKSDCSCFLGEVEETPLTCIREFTMGESPFSIGMGNEGSSSRTDFCCCSSLFILNSIYPFKN